MSATSQAAKLQQDEKVLTDATASLIPAGEGTVEERFNCQWKAMQQKQKQHDSAEGKLRAANEKCQANQSSLSLLSEKLTGLQGQLTGISDSIADNQRRCDELMREIAAVAKTDDPQAELTEVNRKIDQLTKQQQEAKEKFDAARNKHDSVCTEFETAKNELLDADAACEKARAALEAELKKQEFDSVEEALAAYRETAALQALRDQVKTHREQLALVSSRIAELEQLLKGRRVGAADLKQAEERFNQADQELQANREKAADTKRDADGVGTKLKRLAEIEQELAAQAQTA